MSSEQNQHNAFVQWKHTKIGRICWAILAAAIAYVFISLAIDSGALWQWGVAALFLVDMLYNLTQFIRSLMHHDNHHNH